MEALRATFGFAAAPSAALLSFPLFFAPGVVSPSGFSGLAALLFPFTRLFAP